MATIAVPNTFSANTTISASEVNSNFTTIYNEFNGSITAANLASNAVTTAKIADSNVTTAKIADASVTNAKLASQEWSSFTPTINSGSLGNGSLSCEYTQIGKTVIARYNLTFGSTTSVTNTSFSIDLPVTAAANFTEYMFTATISDTGTATYPATARLVSTTAVGFAYHDWSGTIMRLLNIGSAAPITWASSDEINAMVIYEAA